MLEKGKMMLKADFLEKLRTFSEELKSLGTLFDCGFVWHFTDADLLMNVLPEQSEHRHPYCRMIKGDPYRELMLCRHFHDDESFGALRTGSGIRIAECHAGVKTLAVAMTVAGDVKGILFAGPFAGGKPRSQSFQFPSLPDERLKRLGAYLKMRLDNLFKDEWLPESKQPLLTPLTISDRRILWAAHIMRKRCGEVLTARRMAETCELSVSRFLHLFHSETGYTFSDWLQRLRVARACRLLTDSPYQLAEIAEISGIRDQSRMTVLFHRYLKITPREYRISSRRNNHAGGKTPAHK